MNREILYIDSNRKYGWIKQQLILWLNLLNLMPHAYQQKSNEVYIGENKRLSVIANFDTQPFIAIWAVPKTYHCTYPNPDGTPRIMTYNVSRDWIKIKRLLIRATIPYLNTTVYYRNDSTLEMIEATMLNTPSPQRHRK